MYIYLERLKGAKARYILWTKRNDDRWVPEMIKASGLSWAWFLGVFLRMEFIPVCKKVGKCILNIGRIIIGTVGVIVVCIVLLTVFGTLFVGSFFSKTCRETLEIFAGPETEDE